MRSVLVICALLSACIRSDLTTCDELACPVGMACSPAGGCVLPEQLTACSGLADGATCDVRGAAGDCVGGVCQAIGCGNSVVTPGEVCDDGNTFNGDGCSADCRSDETCGNGIPDFAAGEECDDGNTVDGDGCSSTCKLPRCGDGIVDGVEECDPAHTLDTTRTCEDFGYYGGSLGCNTICRLDPTDGCVGRCGDHVLQAAHEDCDGSAPATSCIDYGYDIGGLGCSSVCTADPIHTCELFGWTDLGDSPVGGQLRADGDTAVVFTSSELAIFEGSTSTRLGGTFSGADVLGATILYATDTAVFERDTAGGAFATLPVPTIPSGMTIKAAALADDGTPFVLVADASQCMVEWFSSNSWGSAAATSPCAGVLALSPTNYVVTNGDAFAWTFPGGSRTGSNPGTKRYQFRDSTTLVAYTYDGSVASKVFVPSGGSGAGQFLANVSNVSHLAFTGDQVYALESGSLNPKLARYAFGRSESIPTVSSTSGAPLDVFAGRNGKIYNEKNGRLYQFASIARTTRPPPDASDIVYTSSLAILADNTFAVCGRQLWFSTGATFQSVAAVSASGCSGVWGTSSSNVYAVNNTPSQLVRWNGATFTAEQYQAAPIATSVLTGEGGTVVVVTSTGTLLRKQGTTWSALPALPNGCSAASAAVRGGVVYTGGVCGSVATIWRYDETAWVSVHTEPSTGSFTSLVVTASGMVWAATDAATTVSGTEGGTWTAQTGAVARLAGTDARMFGYVRSGGPLKQWSGTRWTPIRTGLSMNLNTLAASDRDVIAIGATFPDASPITWFGYVLPP